MKIQNRGENVTNHLKQLSHAVSAVLGASFLAASLQAATLTWNAGSGNWDESSSNWTEAEVATTFVSDGTQDVIFSKASGGDIAVSNSMSPLSTTVSASSGTYKFSGGPIIGSGGLTKSGAGQLTMNTANNTFTGKTSIRGGTLLTGGPAYLSNAGLPGVFGAPTAGDDANIDLHNGVTLRNNGSDPRVNQTTDRLLNLAGTGPGTVSIRYNDNDASLRFGGVTATGTGPKTLALYTGVNGNGDREAIIFDGGIADSSDSSATSLEVTFNTQGSENWVSLNGTNTFTGSITLAQIGEQRANGVLVVGGVRVANSGANTVGTGSLGSGNYAGAITLGVRTVLQYDSTAAQTFAGAISGLGALQLTGNGTVTLSGANTYSGNTTVGSGCSLALAPAGSMNFVVTNTSSNKVTGAGTATLDGAFTIDTSAVTASVGTWSLVNTTAKSFGSTFAVTGFTGPVGTVYTNVVNPSKTWTFDTSTGALSLMTKAVFTSFAFNGINGTIDNNASTIFLPVAYGTALATVAPSFTVTSGTPNQTSGIAPTPTWDGSNQATYTITDGVVFSSFTVTLNFLPAPPAGVGSGLRLWLAGDGVVADDSKQVRISGSDNFINQWNDSSGNNNNASNLTEGDQPKYIANALNGKPVLRFAQDNDDTGDRLYLGDLSGQFGGPVTDPYPTATNSGTAGASLNGTYAGTPTRGLSGALVEDSNTATSFNGSSQLMRIPYSPDLNTQVFTAETWVKPGVTSTSAGAIFSSGQPAAGNRSGWVLYQFGSRFSFRAFTGAGNTTTNNDANGLVAGPDVVAGTWYHVAIQVDADGVSRLYVNGAEVGNTSLKAYVASTPAQVAGSGQDAGTTIGARYSNGGGALNHFNGVLDETAFYNTALSAADILAHYENGINTPARSQAYNLEIATDSPVGYYRLNEPAAPLPAAQAATIFAVTTLNNDPRYNLFGNRDNDERWRNGGEAVPGSFRGSRTSGFSSSYWPTNGSHIISLESSVSQYRAVIDGTQVGATSGDYNSGSGQNWTVGNRATSSQQLNGDIAELIIYNRVLSAEEANAVGAYLANKYGLTTAYVVPKTDYETWAESYLPADISSATGDFDNDGLTNQQEYAFGLDPTSGASVSPITQQLDKGTGIFKYKRRATPVETGLTYIYEWSTTLAGTWGTFTPVTNPPASDSGTPVEEITIEVPAAQLANPTLFVRVRAE
jgi:autotransporter-associated beta strand protein